MKRILTTYLKDVIRFTTQILLGVNKIHTAGIMHRDLNPKNIFIGKNGSYRIGTL
jgi:serine/threonine protein kinase